MASSSAPTPGASTLPAASAAPEAPLNALALLLEAVENQLDESSSAQYALGGLCQLLGQQTSNLYTAYEGYNGILTRDNQQLQADNKAIQGQSSGSKKLPQMQQQFQTDQQQYSVDNTVFQNDTTGMSSATSPLTTLYSQGYSAAQSTATQASQMINAIQSGLTQAIQSG